MSSPQGTEVARGYATVVINDQTAAGLNSMQNNVTGSVRKIQSSAQIARNSIQGIFQGLGSNITSTAVGPLLNIGEGLTKLSAQTDDFGNKFVSQMIGIGAATTAVGATLLLTGAKEKQATDQLSQSIQNIGQDYSDYEDQINATVASQAKLGNGAIQVENALTTLVNSTHSTSAAIEDMAEVSDLAAAKHESLNTAAKQVAVTIGGGGRLFRQYNIDIQKNADGTTNYAAMNQKLAAVLSGQASAAADNFGGHLRALGAEVEDAAGKMGEKYGPAITEVGVGLSVVAAIAQIRFVAGLRAAAAAQEATTAAALAGQRAIEAEQAAYSASAEAIVASATAITEANAAAAASMENRGVSGAASGAGAAANGDDVAATADLAVATQALADAKTQAAAATDALAQAQTRANIASAEAEQQAQMQAGQEAALNDALDGLEITIDSLTEAFVNMGLSESQIEVINTAFVEGLITQNTALAAGTAAMIGNREAIEAQIKAMEEEIVAAQTLAISINNVIDETTALGLSQEYAAALTDRMIEGTITEAAALEALSAAAEAASIATEEAATASISLMSVLGPIGLLAGAAAIAFSIFHKSESDSVAPVQGLTEALEAQNGALNSSNASIIANTLQTDGLAKSFDKLKIPQDAATQGLLGNTDAANDTVKALKAVIAAGTSYVNDLGVPGAAGAGMSPVLDKDASAANKALGKYQDLQKQIALQEKEAQEFLSEIANQFAGALGLTATAYTDILTAVDKTNGAYTAGETSIGAQIIANQQLQATLGQTDAQWLKLAQDFTNGLNNASTNGGLAGFSGLDQGLRNADESLQSVTSDFQPLTDAMDNYKQSQLAVQQAVASGNASIKSAVEGLQNAQESQAQTAVSGNESIQSAEESLTKQYVSDAKQIASAEKSVADSQQKAKDAQVALDQARVQATQNIKDAEQTLKDLPEENTKASLALRQAQLTASQDAVTAAQTALNNSTGLTQQQLIDQQNKINEQAAANAAASSQLALDQQKSDLIDAQNQYSDTMAANQKSQADAAATVKDGVDGAAAVIAAQKALETANEDVQSSVTALAQAKTDAASSEQDQLKALSKARTDAATANAKAAKSVQDAQDAVATAQTNAATATATATTNEEANRLKLDEVEIQTGNTDGSINQMSTDIKNADKALTVSFATKNLAESLNGIQTVKQNIEEALLEASGISIADATKKALLDNPPYGASFNDINPQVTAHADGGGVHGPGTKTSDSILARLSDGEWVMKADAVDYYGEDTMDALNNMKYAVGGPVNIDFTKANLAGLMKKSGKFSATGVPTASATAPAIASGPITGSHASLIAEALGLSGIAQTAGNISDVDIIVSHESGWNPNAINLWDSNAAAGHPSQGLMQTIPSTFEAHRLPSLPDNIDDPLANLVAGIRYAVGRYGSLDNVPGVEGVHDGSGYVGYDSGGVLKPGTTMTKNATGKPEAIFTFEQAQALAGAAKNGGGTTIQGDVIFQINAADVKEFNDVVKIFDQLPQLLRAKVGATS